MRLLTFLLILLLTACNTSEQKTKADAATFSFPPEWEPHDAVWTDIASEWTVVPNQQSKLKIISALSKFVPTKVVYDNDSLKEVAVNGLSELSADLSNISFVKTSSPMNWIRDPGPLFVSNGNELKVIDFKWSCYGKVYDCEDDFRGSLNDELAASLGLENDSMDIYLEGGGIEVSNNSILAYRVMADQRNPDRTLKEVTDVLLNAFGKEQVIWLDEFPLIDKPYHKIANYFGNGANGHIDVTTRFMNDSTILATVIAESDKEKSELLREDHRILNSNLEQLKKAKRPNGKPYHIVTIEAPDYSLFEYSWTLDENYMHILPKETQEQFAVGDSIKFVPALEYANFLITNGAVLVSSYWKEGMPESEKLKDERIQKILEEHFPTREIVPLDVLPINWGGGGIHCRTQQQPVSN